MRKLFYNNYKNISDESFLEFKAKLEPIKDYMASILLPVGWKLDNSAKLREVLAVSFDLSEGIFGESMGLLFNEESYSEKFSFVLIKVFDEENTRYYIRGDVAKNKPLSYFNYENIRLCIKDAMELFNKWTNVYIKKFGESIEILS